MDAVRAKFGDHWIAEHLTLFADDTHCGWFFRDEQELERVFTEAAQLLTLLVDMGLRSRAALFTIGGCSLF